jgi:hypothetical protein
VSIHYVKNGGNDSNSGESDLLAWATVSKVNGHTFSPGESCLFKKGSTWSEALNPGQSGTSGSPITFGNYDTGALPILNNTGISVYLERSYVIFDGLHAKGASYAAMRGMGTASHLIIRNCEASLSDRGIEMGTSSTGPYTYIEICDNELHHCKCHGLALLYNGQHLKAYRNHVHDIDTDETGSGGDWTGPIKCFDNLNNMDDVDIYDNYIHTAGRSAATGGQTVVGIWMDATQFPTTHAKIHHNYIADVTRGGIFLELTRYCSVYSNVIVNCGTSAVNGDSYFDSFGIKFDCRSTPGENLKTSDNVIVNNTIYGGRNGIMGLCYNGDANSEISRNTVKNNIAVGQTFRRLQILNGADNTTYSGCANSGNTYEYNCFGTEATNFIRYGSNRSTYAAFDSAYGAATHSVTSDPKLSDPSNGDCTLQSDSPCINAGVDLGASYKYGLMHDSTWPAAVVLGDQGAHGAGWEIGAYIYEAGGSAWIVGALAVGGG